MSKLKYYKSAKRWNQALPLGNGETAVMAFGGENSERLCVNNANLWSGYPKSDDKDCAASLKNVRAAIFEERYNDAHKMASGLDGDYCQAYMPLGEINIKYYGVDCTEYSRELDLDTATFNVKNGDMQRNAFVSYPDKVAVYHSESKSKFSIKLKLSSKLKSTVKARGDVLVISGNAPDYAAPNYLRTKVMPIRYNRGKAMAFAMALTTVSDGEVNVHAGAISVTGATYVDIYFVTHTGFLGYDTMPCVDSDIIAAKCIDLLDVVGKNYVNLLERHVSDYQSLYTKHTLSIAKPDDDVAAMLKAVSRDENPSALINLLYDYGKYMTIAASRDSQPMNLQGQWNNSKRPPWSSNLTTNINFEMNYWGTAAVNLAPCLQPFYRAVEEICANGKKTAKINFNANGFVCNHNVDIWRKTSPVKGNPSYMFAPLCGVWLANEVYSHKRQLNQEIDDNAKDIITSAAKFCLDYLVEHNGQYVTCPSASPEADFIHNGGKGSLGYGSAFEMGLIKQCFANCLSLNVDEELNGKIVSMQDKLYPFVKTSTGINEWNTDLAITDKGHRHFSPLYALYPGDILLNEGYEKEKEWAKQLFDYRMSHAHSSIGWSGAWAICLAARLHDEQKAESLIIGLLKKSVMPNLFGFHPPNYFQIDCNMGFIAGINEVLITSHNGRIELLPACPTSMKSSSISGHIIDGAEIKFSWKDGKVMDITSSILINVSAKNVDINAKLKNVEIYGREL